MKRVQGQAVVVPLACTEDSARDALDVFVALLRKMFLVLEPGTQTHKIRFEPCGSDEARAAMRGNLWRSKKNCDHRKKVALVRSIATKLAEPDGFVFYHIDGDSAYGNRNDRVQREFDAEIRDKVRLLLQSATNRGKEANLFLIVPYYSIESWLYQNTDVALQKCDDADVDIFNNWRNSREMLDEVVKPKEKTHLRDRFNLDLAESGFPANELMKVDKSFAASVKVIGVSSAILDVLKRTSQP